jgi:3-oxoacyl-[acyl-carrier-protein] synthase II
LGNALPDIWEKALAGKSGIRLIERFDTSQFPVRFAGLVTDFDVSAYMSLKEARKCDTFIQYGIAAGIQAMRAAGLDPTSDIGLDPHRMGVAIGSGIGGLSTIEEGQQTLERSGPKRISPFFIPSTIVNMIAGHLSIMYGLKGPNIAISTACTTGTHNIGMGARLIQYAEADVMLVGGSEYASTPLGMSGFAAARALSHRNDAPELASRPWDKDRDGFVLGDGAGVLVLEEYEHAKKRGVPILAELIGFGMSADAFHITRPGNGGAAQSMLLAMKNAEINASEVDYINAHGTSTPVGDLEETIAMKTALGDHAYRTAVSSTKSMTGHLLGAAGAIEAIFCVLSLRDQVVPPTINLITPGEGCDLDYVPNTARKIPVNIALSNSFGFGGTNATLVFKKI